jgi:nucleotide-binding universal stress UspA family protein
MGAVTPLEISGEVVWGSPRDAIVKAAKTREANLVVLGSHGRGLLGRLLLGSVATYVASHVPCSVEIVRKPAARARSIDPAATPGA